MSSAASEVPVDAVDPVAAATEMIVELVHRPREPRRTWRDGCLYNQFSRRNECPDACCHPSRVLSALGGCERRAAFNAALPRCVDRLVADALEDARPNGRFEGGLLKGNLASSLSIWLHLVNDNIVSMYDMDASLFSRAVERAGWRKHPDYPHLLIPDDPDPATMENIELNQRLERALNHTWAPGELDIVHRTMDRGGTPAEATAELQALRDLRARTVA
jgi:hypothetical protein